MTGWTAVLLAGSRPGGDALARAHGVALKAQIPIEGEAMVTRVAKTLLACGPIERIVVLTQSPDELRTHLPVSPRISLQPSLGTIAETLRGFVANDAAPWPLFVTTADHPLLGPATVQDFLERAGADVAVGVVSRDVLRRRFPDNERTWLRFADGRFTGANLFALTGPRALAALDWWAGIEQDRKKGWRLLAKLGPWLLVCALLGRLSLHAALDAMGKRLGVTLQAVPLDDPLAAVDVDKPSDLALASEVLAGRA